MRLATPDDGEFFGVETNGFGIAADQLGGFLVSIKPTVLNILRYSVWEIRREGRAVPCV